MDAGLFIYFPRDPGQNIYFKVFDGQDIYFKESTARPLTKRDQFQPFPNSTDCHTKHIAMLHGLRPSTCIKISDENEIHGKSLNGGTKSFVYTFDERVQGCFIFILSLNKSSL